MNHGNGSEGLLEAVRAAADMSRETSDNYRRAVLEARRAGCTLEAIATAAGVSRQAVHTMIRKAGGANGA